MKSLSLSLAILLCSLSPSALAAKKALIIANNNYKTAISPLVQPIKDGEKIKASLESIHFDDIIFLQDQTLEQTKEGVRAFAENLDKENDIAFVFIAGHGTNEEGDYFVPTDFDDDEKDIPYKAVAINALADTISNHSRHAIFVIDIGRDSLKRRSIAFEVPPATGLGGGLKTKPQINSNFTLYSTGLGKTALDNSKFGEIVAAELRKPQTIEQFRLHVVQQMIAHDGSTQVPSAINQLDDVVYLSEVASEK